ncbi:MAG: ABC transporter permease [Treponemataceae bacterium]|nr:ABC transporter permease [Treponemataceae bacterium]
MKALYISFSRFIKEIFKDAMLAAMTILPLFLGLLFRLGLPALEVLLENRWGWHRILTPYYLLFDLILIFSTPIMFGYAGLMVILEERDKGIMKYLCVTPLGKRGYILTRLVFLSALAAIYAFLVEIFLHLSDISLLQIFTGCLFSFLTGIWTVCLITLLASNKVEGLAFSKFSGILTLGPLASIFLQDKVKYLASFLPTFWFTEFCLKAGVYGVISLLLAFAQTLLYTILTCRKLLDR